MEGEFPVRRNPSKLNAVHRTAFTSSRFDETYESDLVPVGEPLETIRVLLQYHDDLSERDVKRFLENYEGPPEGIELMMSKGIILIDKPYRWPMLAIALRGLQCHLPGSPRFACFCVEAWMLTRKYLVGLHIQNLTATFTRGIQRDITL